MMIEFGLCGMDVSNISPINNHFTDHVLLTKGNVQCYRQYLMCPLPQVGAWHAVVLSMEALQTLSLAS